MTRRSPNRETEQGLPARYATNYIINACNIRKPSDTFFVNFVAVNQATCTLAPFSVTSSFIYGDNKVVATESTGTLVNQKVVPGTTTRLRFNIGTLATTDIVYVKLQNVRNGELTHTVWKSNHIAPDATTPATLPCPGCQDAAQYPYASWHDECWHCGLYDRVYVDVDATKLGASDAFVTFDAVVVKTPWVQLTDTPLSVNLDDNVGSTGIEGTLAFFQANMNQDQGHRIEINVTSGQPVKVEFYGAPCDHRVVITHFCYLGMPCILPLPYDGNFGSFNPLNVRHSLAPSVTKIVIAGQRSTFTIRELDGIKACAQVTPDNAPFCSGHTLRDLAWGDGSTFPQKDARALDRYNELVIDFSCAGECRCVDLSDQCKDLLRQYACDESLATCSDQGFGLRPRARLCGSIETACQKSFMTAGHPDLACFHSFWLANAAKWVNASGTPIRPPNPDLDQTINGQAASSAPAGVPAPTIDTSGAATTGGLGPVADAPEFEVTTDSGLATTGTTADASTAGTGVATSQATGASTATSNSTTGATTASTSQATGKTTNGGPDNNQNNGGGLSGGAIAGIVIGVLVLIAIIIVLVYIFVIRGQSEGNYKNFDQT